MDGSQADRSIQDVIKLTNIFCMPFRLKLVVQISVIFGHFRKDIESLEIVFTWKTNIMVEMFLNTSYIIQYNTNRNAKKSFPTSLLLRQQ
jgi:hypothetical protein